MAHWMACVWHAIGFRETDNPNSWLVKLGQELDQPINSSIPGSGPSAGSRYVTSLYFVITSLTSIGFGNVAPATNAEKIFSILTMLLGGNLSKLSQYEAFARLCQLCEVYMIKII